jgi:hypothetical protein
MAKGKNRNPVITATAREPAAFMWAIAKSAMSIFMSTWNIESKVPSVGGTACQSGAIVPFLTESVHSLP